MNQWFIENHRGLTAEETSVRYMSPTATRSHNVSMKWCFGDMSSAKNPNLKGHFCHIESKRSIATPRDLFCPVCWVSTICFSISALYWRAQALTSFSLNQISLLTRKCGMFSSCLLYVFLNQCVGSLRMKATSSHFSGLDGSDTGFWAVDCCKVLFSNLRTVRIG